MLFSSQGTKVFAGKDGVHIVPKLIADEYKPEKDEKQVHGINSIHISFEPGKIVIADIQLALIERQSKISAHPKFSMRNPDTGEMLYIKQIQFEDGSTWSLKSI